MADWPVRGTHPWDIKLHEAIESRIDGITLDVSHADQALSAANPTVPDLANVNEWTVSGPVQVDLPPADPGSQFTVLVKSGFQGLTWPNGTQVLGETDQSDNVVVTLARLADGWTVFVSSPPLAGGSGAGLDTGWVDILAAYNLGDTTWVTGSAADMGPGWGVGVAPDFGLNVKIRRTGNTLHVAMFGLTKTAPSGSSAADTLFTLPSGITLGANNHVSAVVPYHTASTAPAGLAILAVGPDRRAVLYMSDGTNPPEGTILGRTSGAHVYGNVMMSFPIDPTSVWGT